jgi:hypothetical protein
VIATQARGEMTGTEMRGDRAAAALHALTSTRVAEVLISPPARANTRAQPEAFA